MGTLRNTITVNAPPEAVWAVLGDLTAVTAWVPSITRARMEGTRRVCHTADGHEVHEDISDYSPQTRT